jgi:shikimate kinase
MTTSSHRLPETLSNLLFIGMTGCGKSTMGKALAGSLVKPWVDTDHLLEESEEKELKDLLKELGPEGFKAMEGRVLLGIDLEGHVISTGGSLVYSHGTMEHFRRSSFVIFLNTPLEDLEPRLGNLEARGTVRQPGQSLASLWEERLPLYHKYADLVIDTSGLNEADLLETLKVKLRS